MQYYRIVLTKVEETDATMLALSELIPLLLKELLKLDQNLHLSSNINHFDIKNQFVKLMEDLHFDLIGFLNILTMLEYLMWRFLNDIDFDQFLLLVLYKQKLRRNSFFFKYINEISINIW